MRPTLLAGVTLLCALSPLRAQSTRHEIEARLANKPLYLRSRLPGDTLRFDAAGQPLTPADPTSFTLAGFELQKLSLNRDRLRLDGRRIATEFQADQPVRLPLQVRKGFKTKDQHLTIEIAAPPTQDFTVPLDAIFADGLADLARSLPTSWQPYARAHFLPADQPAQPAAPPSSDLRVRRVGGGVKPPQLLHSADPEFDEAARAMRYSAISTIRLVVGSDGLPLSISVTRPCGLGLDEKAMEAVQRYRFAPATENGNPVPVQINVEVNFQIF